MNKREKIGSVAIQQALRFHFGKTVREVAAIARVSQKTVWRNTMVMMGGTLSWDQRTRKDEVIEAAGKLMA